ncbi:MAG: TIGR03087 family PEP-CTERM/XrtA system glycosyltransferase [Zoogloea sp.]|nr:TIGR03087 family PEP-CTERM/XrtA system glycosyltransferase [Zoogloea sp.]
MRNLLLLAHRLPFPPNKGDKLRSYHLLRHLAARHRVFLGTFIDDPADECHVELLQRFCAGMQVMRLDPRSARLRSLTGLLRGKALTLPYYRDAGLAAWVERTVRDEGIDTAVIFSSAMAQYVERLPALRVLVDFVDVDSAKWGQYAVSRHWPLSSWIYRREARRLLEHERETAARADAAFFVTEAEAALFRRLAPECGSKPETMRNGVDAAYFSPAQASASPYPDGQIPIVFTGAMDYWPNADAASWFAVEVLPELRRRRPQVHFHIVGMRPGYAVQALANQTAVAVTGAVLDVRPYIRHAAVVVAPLRVARGVQNKVLEAMAMARPVVASAACAAGLEAEPGRDFEIAADACQFIDRIDALLGDAARAASLGAAARRQVLARYGWEANLSLIDRHLEPETAPAADYGRPDAPQTVRDPAGLAG